MKHTTGLLIFLLIIVITSISACSSNPLQIVFQSPSLSRASDIGSGEFSILGFFSLFLDKTTVSADLTPMRKTLLTDTLESVDLTNFLTMAPCSDCAKIESVGLNNDNNLVVSIGVKHPFDAGDIIEPVSAKNRADLHVFNVEGIVASSNSIGTQFPTLDESIANVELVNASGYTGYLDNAIDNSVLNTPATIHPYILHFDDYSQGNFDPSLPTGFTSVTTPGPIGNLVMAMGSDYDYRDYIFKLPNNQMSFTYVIGCAYPITTQVFTQRLFPQYRIPQHLKKGASEVKVTLPNDNLYVVNPLHEITLHVEVMDPSDSVAVGDGLDQMKYDSSVNKVEIEIPGIIDGIHSQLGSESVSGTGHTTSDPLIYNFPLTNELVASVGTYTGLVKVTDSYPVGMNESPGIAGKDGLSRVEPGGIIQDGLFVISEFATFASFEINVEEGSIVEPTIYDVGPGYPYADPSEVPWESIEPNSIVQVHWRVEPYRDKWVIARTGTASEPIIVRGIADTGRLPVISGENAKTRLELDYWNEVRSVLKIGGSSFPNQRPAYILIENLDIRSAHEVYSFTDDAGNPAIYAENAAAVHIESGDHITLKNCILHDSGNGLFISDDTTNILIHGNHIYDNGNSASQYEHNSYTSAQGIVFQYNHYGPLKIGSLGNNLKDRSAGCVIRYNWIETGSRMCDLVDSSNPDFISNPAYRETFVYGNVLIKTDAEGNGGIIHYGGDSPETDNYRKGTLYCYNNTIVSYRTSRTTVFQLQTNDESAECFNNLFYDVAGGNNLYIMSGTGNVEFYNNWIQSGWHDVNGTLSGTFNSNDNIEGTNPMFIDFASEDFHLDIGSQCINTATALPAEVLPDNDVVMQYVKHQGEEPRPDDTSLDIGALRGIS